MYPDLVRNRVYMNFMVHVIKKNNKKIKSFEEKLVFSKKSNICKVSIASTEIMLDRFCSGKEIDFPFSN